MKSGIYFTGRLATSLLDIDSGILSLLVEVSGALPTAAALAELHPVERVAVETWGVDAKWLRVEVLEGDLRACAKRLRVGHPITGQGTALDLTAGYTTRHQFRVSATPADLAA